MKNLLIKTTFAGMLCFSSLLAQTVDSTKVVNLDEVNVSSFRVQSDLKNLPQNIQVLNKKDIQEIPNECIGDVLKKTTGIDIVEYPGFSSNIGIRGFAPTAHGATYTLMLVNGVPNGTQNPSTVDVFDASQIEIMKGPYSAFFGSGAMAGVINIVTPQSKDKIHGKVGLSAGSFKTYSFRFGVGGKIVGKLNFDIAAKMLKQNGDYQTGASNLLKMNEYGKEVMEDKSYGQTFKNTRYNKYDANARIGYDFNKDWSINLYQTLFVGDHILSNGNFWGTYGSNEKKIQRWSQNLIVDGKIGANALKLCPYYSNEDADYYNEISDTNYRTTNYNYKTVGFILQDAITLGNHSLVVGIDNYLQKYVNRKWSDPTTLAKPSQPDYGNIASGAFAQAIFHLFGNKVTTALGARYDLIEFKIYETELLSSNNSSGTYQTFNPNGSVKWEILPGFVFTASTGTAFLSPEAFKKTGYYYATSKVYKGNPDLEPEKSFSYDFGFIYSNHPKGISAGITYFQTFHDGLIVYDRSNPDTTTFKNADNAKMNGLECLLTYDFGNLANYKYSLKVYGNMTHMLKTEVTVDNETSNMKYVRKNNGSFGIEFNNLKTVSVRLNVRYIGHRYEDNWLYRYDKTLQTNVALLTNDGKEIRPELVKEPVLKHPEFLVCDLSGNYTFAKKITIGLAIQNVFDENYTEKDGYYMPGRWFTGSLTYSF
jgi:vitamin B12 transporter